MPVTSNPNFPGGISATNIPTLAATDSAGNAGNADGDAIGLAPWGNKVLSELGFIENALIDAPPTSPTAYDDEFNETSIASKWTLVTGTGCTQSLVGGSYLQQNMPQGSGNQNTTISELVTTSTNFMFQWKLRNLLLPTNDVSTVSSQVSAYCGLIATPNKSIGITISQYLYDSAGTYFYYPEIFACRGSTFATSIVAATYIAIAGADLRIRIGEVSSNLNVYLSVDGINWLLIWSESFGSGNSLSGSFPTSAMMGLSGSGSQNNAGLAAWDYIRKIA